RRRRAQRDVGDDGIAEHARCGLAAFDTDDHDIRADLAQTQDGIPELHLLEPGIKENADLAHFTPFAVSCLTGVWQPFLPLSYSEFGRKGTVRGECLATLSDNLSDM